MAGLCPVVFLKLGQIWAWCLGWKIVELTTSFGGLYADLSPIAGPAHNLGRDTNFHVSFNFSN